MRVHAARKIPRATVDSDNVTALCLEAAVKSSRRHNTRCYSRPLLPLCPRQLAALRSYDRTRADLCYRGDFRSARKILRTALLVFRFITTLLPCRITWRTDNGAYAVVSGYGARQCALLGHGVCSGNLFFSISA